MSSTAFAAVQLLATLLDASAALVALHLLSRTPRPVLLRIAGALAAAAAAFAVKAPVLRLGGLKLFGFVNLAYLDLLIIPPLAILAAYAADRRRGAGWARGRLAAFAVALAAAVAPLTGVYASYVEPFDLRLETTAIPLAPARRPANPIRIGVLADIQTARVGPHEHRAIDRLMAERPDVILLPGDIFQGAAGTLAAELPGLRALMAKLHAPGGVYFAMGDCDDAGEVTPIFAGTDVRVLINQVHRTTVRGRALTIAGVELHARTPAARAVIEGLEAPGEDDVRILLTHRPDPVLALPRPTRIDLVVAGHTHGGQVRLPFYGPPIILSQVPRKVGGGGYHLVDGRPIYVSRGVGFEGGRAPRIRFLCPPEVSLLLLGSPP